MRLGQTLQNETLFICLMTYLLNTVALPVQLSIGVGTAGLREKTYGVVCESLRTGFTLIDTAQAPEWYDEELTGYAIRDPGCHAYTNQNLDTFVVTKVHPRSFSSQRLQLELEYSAYKLRKMEHEVRDGPASLDAVLLHSPYCWRGHCNREEESHSWQGAWKMLNKYKHSPGAISIEYIGVSNFDIGLLRQLVDLAPTLLCTNTGDTNCPNTDSASNLNFGDHFEYQIQKYPDLIQNWMDPYHQDREVREFCRKHGIQYMAYSSFGTQWNKRINPVLNSPVLLEIANKHSVSVTQVILSWLKQLNVVSLPKSTSKQHIEDNFSVMDSDFALSDADMALIESLDGTMGTPWD